MFELSSMIVYQLHQLLKIKNLKFHRLKDIVDVYKIILYVSSASIVKIWK